jgi:hypothetical protein
MGFTRTGENMNTTRITHLIQSTFSVNQALPKDWWGYRDSSDRSPRSINCTNQHFGLWVITFDGTPEGCHEAFQNARNSSIMVENIVDQILGFFEPDIHPQRELVKEFVLKNGQWTQFSIIHSSVEHLEPQGLPSGEG